MNQENNLENLGTGSLKRPKNASFPMTVTSLKAYRLTVTRSQHDLIHDILSLKPESLDDILAQQKALFDAIALLDTRE